MQVGQAGAGEGGGGQAGRGEPLCLGDLSAVDPATRCRPPWLQQAGVLPAGPRGGADQPGPGRPESTPAGRAGRPHQLRQDAAGARGPADPKLASLEAAVNYKNVDNTAYKIKNYMSAFKLYSRGIGLCPPEHPELKPGPGTSC